MKKIALKLAIGSISVAGAINLWAGVGGDGSIDNCLGDSFRFCGGQCYYSQNAGSPISSGNCAWNPNGNNNSGQCQCKII